MFMNRYRCIKDQNIFILRALLQGRGKAIPTVYTAKKVQVVSVAEENRTTMLCRA